MSSAVNRRDFLRTASAPLIGLGFPAAAQPRERDVSCILLMLVGGPSQLDTWDMKPDAPAGIRSPFRPIRTNVAGIEISEIFPRMARHADKYSLVRGVHHNAMPVHDVGHQALQTGRVFRNGLEHPHIGCTIAHLKGPRSGAPAHVLLPRPIGATGGNLPHGQDAGYLGGGCNPLVAPPDSCGIHREPDVVRRRYGASLFGQSCLAARRLIEAGARFVTVNMFDTVFGRPTWDSHGYQPFCSLDTYRGHVGPIFDMAYSSLLEDLSDRGLLDTTMVAALGEFGRTPRLNYAGGRDHWPNCWTVLMGGGPLKRGEVIGSSDNIGAFPKDRPVTPAEIAATLYHAFGIDPHAKLGSPGGEPLPLLDDSVQPIRELLA
jgi:hypothetical protein